MNRDEAITRMRRYLKFNKRLSPEFFVDALVDAQQQLEQKDELPWFLTVFEHALVTVADTATIALPSNFIRETEEAPMWYVPASGLPQQVFKSPWHQNIDPDGDNVASGKPAYYRLEVAELRLFPTPDKVYNLRLNYYKSDTLLSTNVENLWLKHTPNLLIGFAGQLVATQLGDQQSLQEFSELRSRGEADLVRSSVARRNAGVEYQMGGPH